jgi:PRC-barrel domain
MLRNSKDLEGCTIAATDGTIGEVKDLYFDDAAWVIRYLVVSTGAWLANRKVLISPFALSQPQWVQKAICAALTKEQVQNSPDIDTDMPVSRQHEMQYLKYYSYPSYWCGAALWGMGPSPNLMPMGRSYEWPADSYGQMLAEHDRAAAKQHEKDDPHLRSCNAVLKYHIHASDGDIGHVAGLLVDDETWAIRYLIADTGNWWLGHQLLVAPEWIHDVSWSHSNVSVELTRKALQDAPPYDATSSLDRGRESELFEYYGRPGYWLQDVNRGVATARS